MEARGGAGGRAGHTSPPPPPAAPAVPLSRGGGSPEKVSLSAVAAAASTGAAAPTAASPPRAGDRSRTGSLFSSHSANHNDDTLSLASSQSSSAGGKFSRLQSLYDKVISKTT
jgi:hypothetical protein